MPVEFVEPKQKTFTANYNDWTYREYTSFVQAFNEANFVAAMRALIPCIVEWSYDPAPTSEALGEMKMSDIGALSFAAMEQLEAVITDIDVDEVIIDLDGWVGNNYDRFLELGSVATPNGSQLAELQKLLRMIATFPDGFELDKGITAVEGWKITKAMQPAIKAIFRKR